MGWVLEKSSAQLRPGNTAQIETCLRLVSTKCPLGPRLFAWIGTRSIICRGSSLKANGNSKCSGVTLKRRGKASLASLPSSGAVFD